MKITLITQNLSSGGVQKSVTNLANVLKDEHELSFLFFEQKDSFFELQTNFTTHYLEQFQIDTALLDMGSWLYGQRVKSMESFFEKDCSDLYIVFEDYNSLVALGANKFDKQIIVSSRVSLEFYKDRKIHLLPYEFYMESIKRLYPKANKVIAVSNGVRDELSKIGVNAVAIYNGIDIKKIKDLTQEPCEYENFLLHVGRIDFAQKGQDDTLKAFYKIHKEIDKSLIFIGDGKDFEKLKNMVLEFGLTKRVFLLGTQKNPYKFLKKCDLLIFSSYFEGMPNAIIEAMATGTAIISYDFLPSAEELSCEGKYFPLVKRGDIVSLASGIVEILSNKKNIDKLKYLSTQRSEGYCYDAMAQKWIGAVNNALRDKNE